MKMVLIKWLIHPQPGILASIIQAVGTQVDVWMRMVWTILRIWKGKSLLKTEQATAVSGSWSSSIGNIALVWGMQMMMLWQGLLKSHENGRGSDWSEWQLVSFHILLLYSYMYCVPFVSGSVCMALVECTVFNWKLALDPGVMCMMVMWHNQGWVHT